MGRYKTIVVNGKQVPEHRAMWEQSHGPIPEGYVIHHINGNGKDNRLENLMLMSLSDHISLHAKMRREGVDPVDSTNPDVIKDRELSKSNYARHREARCVKMREYHATHLEEAKAYREEHREEQRERDRKRYVNNREKELARSKTYREEHRDEINARSREYSRTHREERKAYRESRKDIIAEQGKVYREAHREERAAWQREYYKSHKEEITSRIKAWREANRERVNAVTKVRESRPEYKAYRAIYMRLRRAVKAGKSEYEIKSIEAELSAAKTKL